MGTSQFSRFHFLRLFVPEYRSVQIFAEKDELSIYLVNELGVPEKWEGNWPSSKPPAHSYLLTLNDACQWWSTDFSTHPFTSTFASWLNHSRTTLRWGLSEVSSLIISNFEMSRDTGALTLFQEAQVFTRLSIAFQQWQQRRNNPAEYVRYIRQALSVNLHPFGTALRQIETLEKDKSSMAIPLLPAKTKSSFQRPRSSFPRFQKQKRFQSHMASSSKPPQMPKKCYFCGKMGHTQNVCRLKAKGRVAPPPQNTAQKQ